MSTCPDPRVVLEPLGRDGALDEDRPVALGHDADDASLRVAEVESIDQAIEGANSSAFGLAASVWSCSPRAAAEIARQLRVGIVWINDASAGQPQFPWGGTKRSGWGRLFSREALTELTHVKVVSHDRRRRIRPRFWWFPYSHRKLDRLLAVNELVYGAARLSGLVARLWSRRRSVR